MRYLLVLLMACLAPLTMADTYTQLYQATGWPIQSNHFHEILQEAQKQYKNTMPEMLYQSLVAASNKRFEVKAMNQRAEIALRNNLSDPQVALDFFQSALGKKVVLSETEATSKEQLQKNKQGMPRMKISASRHKLIQRLAQAIPYEQGGVDASLALASITTDTLENMMPGMGIGDMAGSLAPQRELVQKQIHAELEGVLIYVYRNLSDSELQDFINFAESAAGEAYYKAALKVLEAGLNNR